MKCVTRVYSFRCQSLQLRIRLYKIATRVSVCLALLHCVFLEFVYTSLQSYTPAIFPISEHPGTCWYAIVSAIYVSVAFVSKLNTTASAVMALQDDVGCHVDLHFFSVITDT